MKRQSLVLIIVAFAASSLLVSSLGYFWLGQPKQLDTSWIVTVNQMLEDAKPYSDVNGSDPNLPLAYCRIYLLENQTGTLVGVGNTDNFCTNLTNLLNSVNTEKRLIDEVQLDEHILPYAKVVWIQYRTSVIPRSQEYGDGYLVLEDHSEFGLTGEFILQQHGSLEIWAIEK